MKIIRSAERASVQRGAWRGDWEEGGDHEGSLGEEDPVLGPGTQEEGLGRQLRDSPGRQQAAGARLSQSGRKLLH